MEAISHAGTVLAVASKEGIALAAEKVRDATPQRWDKRI
jgi:20S proteasome alpha/beta subunit